MKPKFCAVEPNWVGPKRAAAFQEVEKRLNIPETKTPKQNFKGSAGPPGSPHPDAAGDRGSSGGGGGGSPWQPAD